MITFDIILLVILLLFFILGCIKGFVKQIYDILTFLLSFIISIAFNTQITKYIHLLPVYKNLQIFTTIFQIANRYVAFIISFLGFILIFKIAGIFIKPVLNKSFKIFKVTSLLNSIAGGIISLIKGCIFIYILIIVLMLPVFNTKSYCDDSIICQYIQKYVPYTSEYVKKIEEYSLIKVSGNDDLLTTMINGYRLNVITEDQFIDIFDDNILHNDQNVTYQLNQSDYDLLKNILNKKYAIPAIQPVLDNIEVTSE